MMGPRGIRMTACNTLSYKTKLKVTKTTNKPVCPTQLEFIRLNPPSQAAGMDPSGRSCDVGLFP